MALNRETLPDDLALEPDHNQLPIDAAIPLAAFEPGLYRLEIQIRDNLADAVVTREIKFTVADGAS